MSGEESSVDNGSTPTPSQPTTSNWKLPDGIESNIESGK